MPPLRQLDDVGIYRVGWIAPLFIELAVAKASLDEKHAKPKNFRRLAEDTNAYTWGSIEGHCVVIATLGANTYGTVNASKVATSMRLSLPHLRVGLLVGIGAGLDVVRRDIRLGDVVISRPEGILGGVVQYDLLRNGNGPPERVGHLAKPPAALLQALGSMLATHELGEARTSELLEAIRERRPNIGQGYAHPGQQFDRLFRADSDHVAGAPDCSNCALNETIERPFTRARADPQIHLGIIASGNRLVSNAQERELLLTQLESGCICLEMEAAGVMDTFPCLVIRGICDYADSHKNDMWQRYAAATAAAAARELLTHLEADRVENTDPIRAVITGDQPPYNPQ